ncbi:ABC transporter permease subunit [Gorillibacterium timonense]|uniref:ABC transporter permease subunit n=1 Tax=Gorillibacterium timonense TaxID=1689269 RepID=UPI00071D38EB|nr:ABC transporter permease subunit [Gorillibacterium timonense]
MNVFRREMKAQRKALIIWCVSVFLLMVAGMSKYSVSKESGQAMSELVGKMPPAVQAIFGTSGFDISQASGYYGAMFFYVLLMAAVHASMLGATILAKEERDKTGEFLFVKPLSRMAIVGSKLLAAFVQALVFNAVSWLSSLMGIALYAKGESLGGEIALLMAGMLLVQAVFLTAGAANAAIGRKPKKAAAGSAGLMLATFLISLLIEISGKLGALKMLTPFQYVDAHRVLEGRGLQPGMLVWAVALCTLFLLAAFRGYGRRDLQV